MPAVVLSVVPELLAKISWAVRYFTRLANPSDRSSIVLALKSQSWQIVILSTHRSSKQARKPDLETCFRVQSQGNMTPAHVTLSWESASTLTHTHTETQRNCATQTMINRSGLILVACVQLVMSRRDDSLLLSHVQKPSLSKGRLIMQEGRPTLGWDL